MNNPNLMRYIFLSIIFNLVMLCHAQQGDVFIPFEEAYKRVYHIKKINNVNITVDGKLDEAIWTDPEGWTEDFIVSMPVERLVPKSKTKVKMFMDNKYLYAGFYCKELEPKKLNRFIANRDERTIGDVAAIALDTYHDFRAAIEFGVALGGNKFDLVVMDNIDVNLSWNAVWEARTHINWPDSSWTAEFRIPFNQMRYNYKDTTGIWGINLRRNVRHTNETHKWSLIPRPNSGHVFSFGELHGMVDLPKPKGVEFLPYTIGKFRTYPKIEGSPYQTGRLWNGNVGLDSKIALSDYTLDITINPDYGQVELDPSVMNLTALETFYEEKRPFFLEGRHLLDFNNGNDMMFYTRRIGSTPSYRPQGIDNVNSYAETKENIPIIGAFKLTGTNRDGVSLGIIESLTAPIKAKVKRNGEENLEMVEPLTNYSAVHVQKNWKGNTYIGGMVTSVNRRLNEPILRNYLINNAFTGGIDFTQYFKNRLYYVDFKGMFSSLHGSKEAITRLQERPTHYYQRQSAQDYLGVDPNRTSLSGSGGWLEIGRKGTEKWLFTESFGWSTPGFDLNDMGYMRSTDAYYNKTEISYRQKGIWKKMRANSLTLTQENRWDFGGTPIHNNLTFAWSTTLINRMQFNIRESYGWNFIDNSLLRGGPSLKYDPYFFGIISFNTDKGKRVSVQMQYMRDHNPNGQRRGYRLSNTYTPGLTLRLSNYLYIIGEYTYRINDDAVEYVARAVDVNTSTPNYIMGRIYQKTHGLTFKAQVNITPDISIQYYGSPFTSTASFDNFKLATDTKSSKYENRFHAFTSGEISYSGNTYSVSHNGQNYNFQNPDFSFNEFRSNLVVRWEYLPGSTLYFVWEHARSNRDQYYVPGWRNNLDRMFGLPASNIFMLKMNYWFGL